MSTFALLTVVLAVWIVIGLMTGVWMIRRGHSAVWMLIAVALGPLFVPIALERAERGFRLVRSGPGGPPQPRAEPPAGPRILIGMDGSAESEHALTTAVELFGSTCEAVVLAEVVCYEAAEEAGQAELDAASTRLATFAASLESRLLPVSFDILVGPPAKTLRAFAEREEMDLVVVGRRGRGLTGRLLGSVSADLVEHSVVPVLVAT